ncbi:hypothetical protein ABK040_008360 [Willaertia magna]
MARTRRTATPNNVVNNSNITKEEIIDGKRKKDEKKDEIKEEEDLVIKNQLKKQKKINKNLTILPNELILQIIYYIINPNDSYNFTSTCKYFFKIYLEECCNELNAIRLEYLNGENPYFSSFKYLFNENLIRKKSRVLNLFSNNLLNNGSNTMLTYESLFGMDYEEYLQKLDEKNDKENENEKVEKEEEINKENKEENEEDEEDEEPSGRTDSMTESNDFYAFDEENDSSEVMFFEKPKQMTLSSFVKHYNNIIAGHPMVELMSQIVFEHNRTTNTKERFVVAGGFLLHVLTGVGCCDFDIFCIQNEATDNEIHKSLRKILLAFERLANTKEIKYNILKTDGTLNIASPTNLNIQFILRKIKSIEELLCFFDLDCCRLLFDGENVFTILEGLRALKYKRNILSSEHAEEGMYYQRACKYGKRGFETYFLNDKILSKSLSINHPLFHQFHFDVKWNEMKSFLIEKSKLSEQQLEKEVDEREYPFGMVWGLYSLEAPYFYAVPNGNNDQDVDANFYSVVLKSFDYFMIDSVLKFGLKETLYWASDDYHDGVFCVRFNEFNGKVDLSEEKEVVEEIYKSITRKDIHNFCYNLRELLLKDSSFYFQEGYFESHLRAKYNFYKCYLCKQYCHYNLDTKYQFCKDCKQFNEKQRELKRDLTNKIAIVTGGRIKIGYATALKLLRFGATVIVTTRFVTSALQKYQNETDYNNWKDKLYLYPLNMKDGNSVLQFTNYIKTNFKHVDILINNAAQTVRRPLSYYQALIEKEQININQDTFILYSPATTVVSSFVENNCNDKNKEENLLITLNELEIRKQCLNITTKYNLTKEDFQNNLSLFPKDQFDKFGEPLDLRKENSWGLQLPEVDIIELLETQMINSISPTIIISQLTDILKPNVEDILKNDDNLIMTDNYENNNDSLSFGNSFIINVTSHEGQFHCNYKTDTHIHTNMSKAGLNMLTRSAANYYAKLGILMNSVDTGWISSSIKTFREPPLTVEDGASRILYPILIGSFEYGKLFKDYKVVEDW